MKTFKTLLGCVMAATLVVGCDTSDMSVDNSAVQPDAEAGETRAGLGSFFSFNLNPVIKLSTDKVSYAPSSVVKFRLEGNLPAGARIRYSHGTDAIDDYPLSGNEWTWTVPNQDYKGYLAQVYTVDGDKITILGTIGIDVSSDWGRYPRYGFVSHFGDDKTPGQVSKEVAKINRLHLNGVQFYDWMYKHNVPYYSAGDEYEDISNRKIKNSVIRDYISKFHGVGAKCMFYDLAYGSFDDGEQDGVDKKWGWYDYFPINDQKTDFRLKQRAHELRHIPWKSDIMLQNPGNYNWQQYMAYQAYHVYNNLDFDGFHIDQLGKQGDDYYDYQGNRINIEEGIGSFIKAMKESRPEKDLVMNSVSNYARRQIVGSGAVKFAYNEVWWGSEEDYPEFYRIIKANKEESGNENMATVFAAYVNHEYPKGRKKFNDPSVLLTDAVIFALGGSHLELSGTHMLNNPYFPNDSLSMSTNLESKMINYYDFLVAYENYLRDGGLQFNAELTTPNYRVKAWEPVPGAIVTYSIRNHEGNNVINLLNFTQMTDLNWRDSQCKMKPAGNIDNQVFTILDYEKVTKVWVASPDYMHGAPIELKFTHKDNKLCFVVPSLKYWTMLVVEHGK